MNFINLGHGGDLSCIHYMEQKDWTAGLHARGLWEIPLTLSYTVAFLQSSVYFQPVSWPALYSLFLSYFSLCPGLLCSGTERGRGSAHRYGLVYIWYHYTSKLYLYYIHLYTFIYIYIHYTFFNYTSFIERPRVIYCIVPLIVVFHTVTYFIKKGDDSK